MEQKHDTIPTLPVKETVSLCSGGGCCPEAQFCGDGAVWVSDGPDAVKMTYQEAVKLCGLLLERGYGE